MVDPSAYLQEQQQKFPQFAEWWSTFLELYNKRLWHQLTLKLQEFVKLPDSPQVDLTQLYEQFMVDFEVKINALALVEICVFILMHMRDYEQCLSFISKLNQKVKSNQNASLLCQILTGKLKLVNNDLKGVKQVLEEVGPIIDDQTGVTPVHARYYELSSSYYQVIGNHCLYYRDALRFLGCSHYEDLSEEEAHAKAFALALAALLGESIFNFGELLQHPIVASLKSRHQWLIDLLNAFNTGNLEQFQQLRPQWITQSDLAAHELPLRQKISLLCLMELTFKSPNGVLSFEEIASKAFLPIDDVELLVMKALSENLVGGKIDQVQQQVRLHWVQPRVLQKEQVASLRSRLDNWCQNIRKVENLMESRAQDIIG